ncbi:MAG: type II toxin-antitoxin system VapC family toxin [Paludibacter sp.]|nr:type II toxin-antitoxin system VapC family toxin [Paludibacter sp.]
MKTYVLDTCILVHFLQESPLAKKIEKELEITSSEIIPIISSVTKGELISFAKQRKWGNDRITRLNNLLNKINSIDVSFADNDLQTAYSEIDAFSKRKTTDSFGNLLQGNARTMGKNDLWIAATAKVLDAELITADSDFDHLHNTFITVQNYRPLKSI